MTKPPYSKYEAYKYFYTWAMAQLSSYISKSSKFESAKDEYAKRFLDRLYERPEIEHTQVDTYNSMEELGGYEVFKKKYLMPGEPVIIKGAANHFECVKNWDLDFFAKKYGADKLPFLHHDDPLYKEVPIKEVCEKINDGSQRYAKFSGLIKDRPELLNDFDLDLINKTRAVLNLKSSVDIFIGGANTITNMHTAISNVTFVQVHGKKVWYTLPKEWSPLLNPIIDKQPQLMVNDIFNNINSSEKEHLFKRLPIREVPLEGGDIYFNPSWNWHAVKNDDISIGVAFRWLPFRSAIQSPLLTSIVLLKQLGFATQLDKHLKGQYFPTKWP